MPKDCVNCKKATVEIIEPIDKDSLVLREVTCSELNYPCVTTTMLTGDCGFWCSLYEGKE